MKVVLAFLALLAGTAAFEVISQDESVATRIVTDEAGTYTTAEGTNTLIARCDGSDYGHHRSLSVAFPNGDAGILNFSCGTPVYRFELHDVAYVPEDGVLAQYEACTIVAANEPSAKRSKRVRLEALSENHATYRVGGNSITFRRLPHRRGGRANRKRMVQVQFSWNDFGRSVTRDLPWGNTIDYLINGGPGGGGCPKCVSQDEFDDLNTEVRAGRREANAMMQQFVNSLNDVAARLTNQDNRLAGIDNQVVDIVDGQIEAFGIALNLTGRQDEFSRQLTASLDAKLAENDARVTAANGAIFGLDARVGNLSNSLDAGLRTAMNYTRDGMLEMRSWIERAQNMTADEFSAMRQQFEQVSVALSTQAAIVQAVIRRDIERTQLITAIHEMMGTLRGNGFIPFLRNQGLAPAPNTTAFPFMEIDSLQIDFVTGAGQVVKKQASYRCSSRSLLKRTNLNLDATKILQGLGPPASCNPADADSCNCWLVVQSLRCTRNSTYNFTDSARFADFTNATTLSPAMCSSGVTTTTDAILSSEALMSHWLNSTTAPCQSLLSGTTFAITSATMSKQVIARHDPGLCAVDAFSIRRAVFPPVGAPLNPLIAVLHLIGMSTTVSGAGVDVLERLLSGQIPGELNFQEVPFARRPHPANESLIVNAACTQTMFAAYTNSTLPLRRLVPLAAEVTVTGTVTRLPGGILPPSTEAIPVQTITLSVPLERILPGGETYVVGDLSGEVAYDIPQNDISAALFPSGNAGKVGYVSAANRSEVFDQGRWIEANGDIFHADEAVTVPSMYAVDVVDGVCVGERSASIGSICQVRDQFVLSTVYPIVSAVPRGGSYLFTAKVPYGDLTEVVYSACPSISYGEKTPGGVTLDLAVTQQLPAPVRAVVVVSASNPSCSASEVSYEVDISPGTVSSVFIPDCAFAGNLTAAVFRLQNASGLLPVQCSAGEIDVTAPPATYFAERGIVADGRLQQVAQVSQNVALVAVQGALLDLQAERARFLGVDFIALMDAMGFPLNNAALDVIDGILRRMTNESSSYLGPLVNQNVTAANYSLLYQTAMVNSAAQLAAASAILQDLIARVNATRSSLTNFSAEAEVLQQVLILMQNVSQTWVNLEIAQANREDELRNLSIRAMVATADALRNSGDPGFDFGSTPDWLQDAFGSAENLNRFASDLVRGGINVVEEVVDRAINATDRVVDTATDGVGSVTDGLGSTFKSIVDIAVLIALVIGSIFLVKNVILPLFKKNGSTGSAGPGGISEQRVREIVRELLAAEKNGTSSAGRIGAPLTGEMPGGVAAAAAGRPPATFFWSSPYQRVPTTQH